MRDQEPATPALSQCSQRPALLSRRSRVPGSLNGSLSHQTWTVTWDATGLQLKFESLSMWFFPIFTQASRLMIFSCENELTSPPPASPHFRHWFLYSRWLFGSSSSGPIWWRDILLFTASSGTAQRQEKPYLFLPFCVCCVKLDFI